MRIHYFTFYFYYTIFLSDFSYILFTFLFCYFILYRLEELLTSEWTYTEKNTKLNETITTLSNKEINHVNENKKLIEEINNFKLYKERVEKEEKVRVLEKIEEVEKKEKLIDNLRSRNNRRINESLSPKTSRTPTPRSLSYNLSDNSNENSNGISTVNGDHNGHEGENRLGEVGNGKSGGRFLFENVSPYPSSFSSSSPSSPSTTPNKNVSLCGTPTVSVILPPSTTLSITPTITPTIAPTISTSPTPTHRSYPAPPSLSIQETKQQLNERMILIEKIENCTAELEENKETFNLPTALNTTNNTTSNTTIITSSSSGNTSCGNRLIAESVIASNDVELLKSELSLQVR